MLNKIQFQLCHTLPNEFEIVYATLLDFKKFGEIHPYMTQVEIVKNNAPEFVEYKIIEEIYFFGFIKNHPIYNAKVMEVEKGKHIRYLSQVKKNIFLTVDFTFSRNKGSLIVNESLKIESNPLIGKVFGNILKKAHLKFFKNMNELLHTSIEDLSKS